MKRKDLYTNLQTLELVKDLKGLNFAIAILKNKRKMEEEIKIFEEVIKPNPNYEEYEKKRITLCELHSEKNENGTPIIIGDKYKLIDMDLFNGELEVLKASYNEVIQERINQINEYNLVLEEDINIEMVKVLQRDLPESLTANQLELLDFMITFD